MSSATGWGDILDANEKIIWQGRPDGAVTFGARNITMMVFGTIFGGFALFWMVLAAASGGWFWMFGLIHFSVGVGIVLSALFWGAWRRRHTWYTLSDRRAFIATDMPIRGKRLKSWPITADTALELIDAPLATVNFATETKRGEHSTYEVAVGFERIPDGQQVYRMMRDIQANAQARVLLDDKRKDRE
jgi:hypothetical protein